jgi:sulfate adenylyltransferase subunit 2
MKNRTLTHLKQLEAESIYIIREVAAEFENPVMLYSIGKDSSVMLHLAMKAFYPGKPPFPLMHIDTTWKFREMIEFRERRVKELGLDLIVYVNEQGIHDGINPFVHGSKVYTDIMKTEGLKQALDNYKFDAAFGGLAVTRKNPGPRKGFFPCAMPSASGIRKTSGPNCGIPITGG